jgi:hypothetical protein
LGLTAIRAAIFSSFDDFLQPGGLGGGHFFKMLFEHVNEIGFIVRGDGRQALFGVLGDLLGAAVFQMV